MMCPSGIQTWIVVVDGEHTDHLTTTKDLNYLKYWDLICDCLTCKKSLSSI